MTRRQRATLSRSQFLPRSQPGNMELQGCKTALDKFLALLAVIAIGFHFQVSGATTEHHGANLIGLQCLLVKQKNAECLTKVAELPEHLVHLVGNLSIKAKSKLDEEHFHQLAPMDIAELHPVLVHILPPRFMRELPGIGLAMLMIKHRQDSALAVKIVEALQSVSQQTQFFDELIGTELPLETQQILGAALASWKPNMTSDWTFETFHTTLRNGSPLMAYLPPSVLTPLKEKLAIKFLYHLRSWHRTTLRSWDDNSSIVKRIWAYLVIRGPYTQWREDGIEGFEFLFTGATVGEIASLSHQQIGKKVIFSSKFDKLQARAIFNLIYGLNALASANLTEILPIALQLAPRDLQHFNPNATDFRLLSSVTPDRRTSSFVTDKQILEALRAQGVLSMRLPSNNPEMWQDRVRELNRFVYVLPGNVLHEMTSSRLSAQTLMSIDSDNLSRHQAWLLTGQGKWLNPQKPMSVLRLRGMLKSMYISSIAKHRTGELPQNVLNDLAINLPDFEPTLSLAVLQKLRLQLGETSTLENLLNNKKANQFFTFVTPREVKSLSREMVRSLRALNNGPYGTKIKSLPRHLLTELLMSTQPANGQGWTVDQLVNNEFFMGLSCQMMDKMDEIDAVDLLSHFNRELQALHLPFPKSLQYCTQHLVTRYSAMKAHLGRTWTSNPLDSLDTSEIHAVGGYVLSSYPVDFVKTALHRMEILEVIAKQPLPWLLEAAGRRDSLYRYATLLMYDMLYEHAYKAYPIGIDELIGLGSLLQFIPLELIRFIEPAAFKLYIESLTDGRSKTICSNRLGRQGWSKLIEDSFGPPDKWRSDTLATLGDLLLPLPSKVLDSIPAQQWNDAADSLIEQTSYHLNIIWMGIHEPISFVEVCQNILAREEGEEYRGVVQSLLRRYLYASQSQLGTVLSANVLIASVRMFENSDHQVKVLSGLEPVNEGNKIEVVQPKEVRPKKLVDFTTKHTVLETTTNKEEPKQTQQDGQIESVTLTLDDDRGKKISTKDELHKEINTSSTTGMPATAEIFTENPLDNEIDNFRREKKTITKRDLENEVNNQDTSPNTFKGILGGTPSVISTAGKNDDDNRIEKKVSCDAIRSMGLSAGLALSTRDIEIMSVTELHNCLETLGNLRMDHDIYMKILARTRKEQVHMELFHLGHLVQAIELGDVKALNLSLDLPHTLDTLAVLGRELKHLILLETLSERFVSHNSDVSTMSVVTLVALGRIACDIPIHQLRKIAGTSFLDVVASLGHVSNCHAGCVDKLVKLAKEENAFGPPAFWSAEDLTVLGDIPAGLLAQDWQLVRAQEFVGLQPRAINCIPPHIFKEFSIDQLSHLTPLAASVISDEQLLLLSSEKRSAVFRVQNQQPLVLPKREYVVSPSLAAAAATACFRNQSLLITFLISSTYLIVHCFMEQIVL